MRVHEDELFSLDESEECSVPGYLVLRVKAAGATLPDLDPMAAGRLGAAREPLRRRLAESDGGR